MNLNVKIPCPKCKAKFAERMSNIHSGGKKICPSCGVTINYTGDDCRKLLRQLDGLQQKARGLGLDLKVETGR